MVTVSASEPVSWQTSVPIVRTGHRPAGSIMVSELAHPLACERIVGELAASTGSCASATTALLRAAVTAITQVVLRPFLLESAVVDVAPSQLGLLLGDDLSVRSILVTGWSESHETDGSDSVARRSASMLLPVLHTLREHGALGPRGTAAHLADSIELAVTRIARGANSEAAGRSQQLIEALVHEIAPRRARPLRRLEVQPDDGPTVVLPLQRVCCAGLRVAGPGACPTCPQLASDEMRVLRTVAWLRDLDDDQFATVTGRPRVQGSSRS